MPGALKISEAAYLAIHAVIVLGGYPLRSIPVHEIAEKINASKDHLAKVMQRLNRAGYVTSVRGPKGGFSLTKRAEEITLLDIYELIEGPLIVNDCLLDEKICKTGLCPLDEAMREVNTKLKEFFQNTRISELTGAFEDRA
jgi:Rrf2 family protein